MAKGEGFEPSIRDKPYTRLAGERLQPLGHPFIRLLFSSRFELLASPVARNERAFTLPFAFVQVLFFKSCIFFATLIANATFPPLSAISLGLFSGILGRPISLSLNTGFCRLISLSLNTGFWLRLFRPLGSIRLRGAAMCSFHCAHTPRCRPIAVGNTGSSSRGCASLTPGCVLAPLQGARCVDDCLPGVALRLPRAVFWRPFRAYVSETPNGVIMDWGRHSPGVAGGYSREPLAGFIFPHAKSPTPALRA